MALMKIKNLLEQNVYNATLLNHSHINEFIIVKIHGANKATIQMAIDVLGA